MFFYIQVCHHNPSERTKFIRCIYNLLNSNSSAVRYEAAGTLVTLSTAPAAVKVCFELNLLQILFIDYLLTMIL